MPHWLPETRTPRRLSVLWGGFSPVLSMKTVQARYISTDWVKSGQLPLHGKACPAAAASGRVRIMDLERRADQFGGKINL